MSFSYFDVELNTTIKCELEDSKSDCLNLSKYTNKIGKLTLGELPNIKNIIIYSENITEITNISNNSTLKTITFCVSPNNPVIMSKNLFSLFIIFNQNLLYTVF